MKRSVGRCVAASGQKDLYRLKWTWTSLQTAEWPVTAPLNKLCEKCSGICDLCSSPSPRPENFQFTLGNKWWTKEAIRKEFPAQLRNIYVSNCALLYCQTLLNSIRFELEVEGPRRFHNHREGPYLGEPQFHFFVLTIFMYPFSIVSL